MAAETNNTTTTSYQDTIVETDLKKLGDGADTDESFGTIRTRLRLNGTTVTATTDVSILTDTATGLDEIDELCEDVIAHFAQVKTVADGMLGG